MFHIANSNMIRSRAHTRQKSIKMCVGVWEVLFGRLYTPLSLKGIVEIKIACLKGLIFEIDLLDCRNAARNDIILK